MALVEVRNVTKTFQSRAGAKRVHAVNGVSFEVEQGQTLSLIGESGSGKSTTARLVLHLSDPDSGEVVFDGVALHSLKPKQLAALRAQMTMVFQEPMASLNPRMKVGEIVGEPLLIHSPKLSAAQRRARVEEVLGEVALDPRMYDRYSSQLSGGQQQRVGIARAVATGARFVVLDEPTSALDLSVRAEILMLLERLKRDHDLAFLLIAHDIRTVEYLSDRVAVMYLGEIVEMGSTDAVLGNPRHPYTRALLAAELSADPDEEPAPVHLGGQAPKPTDLPHGCFFASRCPIREEACVSSHPELVAVGEDHYVRTRCES